MKYHKARWFSYIVLVGLMPFFARLFVYFSLNEKGVGVPLHETDLAAFGLVLQVANVNELEHFDNEQKSWKTMHNGLSVCFIIFFTAIFVVAATESMKPGTFNQSFITVASVLSAVTTLCISYSIFDRMSKWARSGDVI